MYNVNINGLFDAISTNDWELIQYYLKFTKPNMQAKNNDKQSLLYCALANYFNTALKIQDEGEYKKRSENIIGLLIKHGADDTGLEKYVDALVPESPELAYFWSCKSKNLLHIILLSAINNGMGQLTEKIVAGISSKEIDNCKWDDGLGALHMLLYTEYFAKDEQLKIFKLLIKKNIDINVTNNNGETPLDFAIAYGANEEIIRYLKSKNAKYDNNRIKKIKSHEESKKITNSNKMQSDNKNDSKKITDSDINTNYVYDSEEFATLCNAIIERLDPSKIVSKKSGNYLCFRQSNRNILAYPYTFGDINDAWMKLQELSVKIFSEDKVLIPLTILFPLGNNSSDVFLGEINIKLIAPKKYTIEAKSHYMGDDDNKCSALSLFAEIFKQALIDKFRKDKPKVEIKILQNQHVKNVKIHQNDHKVAMIEWIVQRVSNKDLISQYKPGMLIERKRQLNFMLQCNSSAGKQLLEKQKKKQKKPKKQIKNDNPLKKLSDEFSNNFFGDGDGEEGEFEMDFNRETFDKKDDENIEKLQTKIIELINKISSEYTRAAFVRALYKAILNKKGIEDIRKVFKRFFLQAHNLIFEEDGSLKNCKLSNGKSELLSLDILNKIAIEAYWNFLFSKMQKDLSDNSVKMETMEFLRNFKKVFPDDIYNNYYKLYMAKIESIAFQSGINTQPFNNFGKSSSFLPLFHNNQPKNNEKKQKGKKNEKKRKRNPDEDNQKEEHPNKRFKPKGP
ncbi:MAG: ankyrin repeat domain-containing protein [Gammaproteobacteria bacterium]|jgi:hypothetical protein